MTHPTEVRAQLRLCEEFLEAAGVDETFGVLDIEAKRDALVERLDEIDREIAEPG